MTVRTPASVTQSSTPRSSAVLRELISHLQHRRARLRDLWLHRILDGQYLTAMSAEEICAETTSMYDSYLEVLGNGQRRGVTPARSSAVVISGFFMNQVQIRPVRRFSALNSVMPRSMPITSGLIHPVVGWNASAKP